MRRIAARPARRNLAIGGSFFANEVVIGGRVWFPEVVPLTHVLRKIKNFLRNVFAREVLGSAPPAPPRDPNRRHFAAILFGREELPLDPPEAARRRAGALAGMFARETLPEDPPAPPRPARPGLLHVLFSPEPLPELPAAPQKPARAAWLRWLFRLERLDPP
jgi:hypothetical protein